MSPEFSRPCGLDRIGAAGLEVTVVADAAECVALAARMRLPAIATLSCRFRLRPAPAGCVDATGVLMASVTQICVVSLDEFPAHLVENFAVRFVPAGAESADDDPDAVDEIPFTGTALDLGEAAAEQLALALDPYPRKPGLPVLVDERLVDEPRVEDVPDSRPAAPENPFAGLAGLRRKH